MGKERITRKDLREMFPGRVYQCSYCALQDIMIDDPVYYNAGMYGWNYDVYIDYGVDIAITSGYRSTHGKTIPCKLIAEFAKRGRKISDETPWNEGRRERLLENQKAFMKAVAEV